MIKAFKFLVGRAFNLYIVHFAVECWLRWRLHILFASACDHGTRVINRVIKPCLINAKRMASYLLRIFSASTSERLSWLYLISAFILLWRAQVRQPCLFSCWEDCVSRWLCVFLSITSFVNECLEWGSLNNLWSDNIIVFTLSLEHRIIIIGYCSAQFDNLFLLIYKLCYFSLWQVFSFCNQELVGYVFLLLEKEFCQLFLLALFIGFSCGFGWGLIKFFKSWVSIWRSWLHSQFVSVFFLDAGRRNYRNLYCVTACP